VVCILLFLDKFYVILFPRRLILLLDFQVRDYIHVQDLATGHSAALHKLFTTPIIGAFLITEIDSQNELASIPRF
jgi:hypothetical protein